MMKFLSGEFVFRWTANGGAAVLFRSIWVAVIVYAIALLLNDITDPNTIMWKWSCESVRAAIHSGIPWFGAIFAGVYVSLYTRFSSQWSYLAGLYNQILQAEATCTQLVPYNIDVWWAAFLEDALELHLATKPMFAALIRNLLARPGVRTEFEIGVPGGPWR